MSERPILMQAEMVRATKDGRKTQTRRVIKPQPQNAERAECQAAALMRIDIESGRYFWRWLVRGEISAGFTCPYGQPENYLWVKETFAIESNFNVDDYPPPFSDGRPIRYQDDPDYGHYWEQCHYRATDPAPEIAYEDIDEPTCRWRPSVFMPRWASRILLKVTDIRVERVQDISEEDAMAEGLTQSVGGMFSVWLSEQKAYSDPDPDPRVTFMDLWNSINAKPRPVYRTINGRRYLDHYISYPWEDVQETREHRGLKWFVHGNPWVWALTFAMVNLTTKDR